MFYGCSALTELELRPLGDNKCSRAGAMINACDSLEELYLCTFQNITDMSFFMQNGMCNTNVKRIHAEDMNTTNVTNMEGMFLNCKGTEEITFRTYGNASSTSFSTRNVTNMKSMFMRCEALKSIDLSFFDTSKVITMETMFMECKSLKTIDFIDKTIGFSYFTTPALAGCAAMFYGCSSLEELDLGNFDTRSISGNVPIIFDSNCTSLTKLRVCDKVNWQTIQDATNLQELIISPKMVHILSGAFGGRSNLITVNIEDGVQTIGASAFGGCTGLKNVTISNTVTQIGDNAFASCSELEEITIPGSVTRIGYSFGGCTKLRNVTILNGVTQLSGGAFAGCPVLKTITIPYTVTQINAGAFSGCTTLTDIYYGGTTAQWNSLMANTPTGGNESLTAASVHTTDNP